VRNSMPLYQRVGVRWHGVAEKSFTLQCCMLEVTFFYPDPDHTLVGPRVLSGNQMIDFCKIQCFLSGFGSHPGGRPQILSGSGSDIHRDIQGSFSHLSNWLYILYGGKRICTKYCYKSPLGVTHSFTPGPLQFKAPSKVREISLYVCQIKSVRKHFLI